MFLSFGPSSRSNDYYQSKEFLSNQQLNFCTFTFVAESSNQISNYCIVWHWHTCIHIKWKQTIFRIQVILATASGCFCFTETNKFKFINRMWFLCCCAIPNSVVWSFFWRCTAACTTVHKQIFVARKIYRN